MFYSTFSYCVFGGGWESKGVCLLLFLSLSRQSWAGHVIRWHCHDGHWFKWKLLWELGQSCACISVYNKLPRKKQPYFEHHQFHIKILNYLTFMLVFMHISCS